LKQKPVLRRKRGQIFLSFLFFSLFSPIFLSVLVCLFLSLPLPEFPNNPIRLGNFVLFIFSLLRKLFCLCFSVSWNHKYTHFLRTTGPSCLYLLLHPTCLGVPGLTFTSPSLEQEFCWGHVLQPLPPTKSGEIIENTSSDHCSCEISHPFVKTAERNTAGIRKRTVEKPNGISSDLS
jgi:hypothetical protein